LVRPDLDVELRRIARRTMGLGVAAPGPVRRATILKPARSNIVSVPR